MKILLCAISGIVLYISQAHAQTPTTCTEAYNWCMRSENNYIHPSNNLGDRCKRGREICMKTGNNPAQGLTGLKRQ